MYVLVRVGGMIGVRCAAEKRDEEGDGGGGGATKQTCWTSAWFLGPRVKAGSASGEAQQKTSSREMRMGASPAFLGCAASTWYYLS